MVCETILILGLILQLPCWNGGFESDVCCSLPGMAVGNLDGPSWSAPCLRNGPSMDCSKNPHGFLFGFSHIKFGISGNGILPPTWAKKIHIFGASSLEHPPLPSFAPGNKSSWSLELLGQSGCSKTKGFGGAFCRCRFLIGKSLLMGKTGTQEMRIMRMWWFGFFCWWMCLS